MIASLDYVRSNLRRKGVDLVDARLNEYYSGEKIPQGQRAGHIPGAVNLTFASLTDGEGRLKPREELAGMFRQAGIKPGDRVVSYCHIGQQASLIYFVARYLGYDARMYDGSWQEWSAHTELPAEVAASTAPVRH